jgi:DNA-binding transcriptional regulator YiaG
MIKKYRSDALAALHETAQGLHHVDLIDAKTMRDFNASCLTKTDAAQRANEQAGIVRLSRTDQECFAPALLSPPKPTPALKRAFTHRRKLLTVI